MALEVAMTPKMAQLVVSRYSLARMESVFHAVSY